MLATKVHGRMRPGPNGAGLSRKAILHEIDASLRRLGTDYVDLYQIHRWDHDDADRGDDGGAARRREGRQGPLHRRLLDVRLAVRQGPARRRPRRLDPVRLDAEPLQPALPRGGAGDAAAVPRPGRRRDPVEPAGPRPADPRLGRRRPRAPRPTSSAARSTATRTRRSSTRSPRSPSGAGVSRAQVALAWLLAQPAVTSPIVGATKPQHLDDAVAAVDLELADDELEELGRRLRPARRSPATAEPAVDIDERVAYAEAAGWFRSLVDGVDGRWDEPGPRRVERPRPGGARQPVAGHGRDLPRRRARRGDVADRGVVPRCDPGPGVRPRGRRARPRGGPGDGRGPGGLPGRARRARAGEGRRGAGRRVRRHAVRRHAAARLPPDADLRAGRARRRPRRGAGRARRTRRRRRCARRSGWSPTWSPTAVGASTCCWR